MNVGELASRLHLSTAIVSRHVQQMEAAGIIVSESAPGERGRQKICRLLHDRLTIVFRPSTDDASSHDGTIDPTDSYRVSIPVGQYSLFQVKPTCGLASADKLIGMRDDPRYFADPEHVEAQHLWFGSGYVEYRIPNYIAPRTRPTLLRVTLEIGSEAPGYCEEWPSDIEFSINGVTVGKWTSPGDYGSSRGRLNPGWWPDGDSQHGSLKTLMLTDDGAFIDGVPISPMTIADLGIRTGEEIRFRIASSETAAYPGGVSLYGKRFGNYPQDIEVKVQYAAE